MLNNSGYSVFDPGQGGCEDVEREETNTSKSSTRVGKEKSVYNLSLGEAERIQDNSPAGLCGRAPWGPSVSHKAKRSKVRAPGRGNSQNGVLMASEHLFLN